MTPALFTPFDLRGLRLRNRIVISPMCQYSAEDGEINDWHVVQYGRFAIGGAGMVMIEATSVLPEGRITPGDLGIWSDAHIPGLRRIADFVHAQGAASGIQLGHAGRKAATQRPWHGAGPLTEVDRTEREESSWPVVAPSPIAVGDGWPTPDALDDAGISTVRQAFIEGAKRALAAGIQVIELHCAHGYLLHQFLSPLSNKRTDQYGGDRERRMRLPLEIARDLREIWPEDQPVMVRVSAVDNVDGGIEIDDTVAFARELKKIGVDAVDCSAGGLLGAATAGRLPRGPGFQVPFAEAVRREGGIASMAVGLILTAGQAEAIIANGSADLVAIGRAALEDPNWPLHAARELAGESYEAWPSQHGWWLERRSAILKAIQN